MAISSGPQYGSLERAWGAIMTEADKVSELHQEVKNNLLNEDLEKVKNWQKDAYHKQIMGGFKETKEAEDGFRKAQKPWAKKMKEVPGGGCYRGGEGGRLSSEGQSDQREGVHRWGGGALPSGMVPWGSRPYPQTGQAPQRSPGVCPGAAGCAGQGDLPRWALLPNTGSQGLHPSCLLRLCAHSSWQSGQVGGLTSARICSCSQVGGRPPVLLPHS